MQNEAQYKISALSSNNLEKYEYFTGEDLGLKPSTVERDKFEYSPLGKVFTKDLEKEEHKKEGLFKRFKNIESKNKAQLKVIEDQGKKQLDAIKNININSKPLKTIIFFSTISEKAKRLMENIKHVDDWLDSAQLLCTKTGRRTKCNFSNFTFLSKFTSKTFRCDLTLQKAKDDQVNLETLINKLINNYNPKNLEKIKEKDDSLGEKLLKHFRQVFFHA